MKESFPEEGEKEKETHSRPVEESTENLCRGHIAEISKCPDKALSRSAAEDGAGGQHEKGHRGVGDLGGVGLCHRGLA